MFTSDLDGDKRVCSVVQTDLGARGSATDLAILREQTGSGSFDRPRSDVEKNLPS